MSQEFRLASNFSGPFNFSVGGNYLHYETEENYYVFINALTALHLRATADMPALCPGMSPAYPMSPTSAMRCDDHWRRRLSISPIPIHGGGTPTISCVYIDPNPITSLNNEGHNYFLSQNPYTLNSYAGFGEAYYKCSRRSEADRGLALDGRPEAFHRYSERACDERLWLSITGVVDQQWDQFTGRAVANWTPKLDFTDQTLIYASYAHGYKAGGANPPGAVLDTFQAERYRPSRSIR